ncbi:MAG: M99 family carboxypeptidase catalytic domain-containing protein [Campylobacterota bacterium]|nr:M99 family carboxypeptidase catalytic domain-containing protein [Campylobacterota bacterium]
MRLLFIILFSFTYLHAYNFNLIKLNHDDSPTLLVVGGIHGNEPGGYFAPAILATHYKITKGSLWIVPDLNRVSIQSNMRGIHGDMNRKFSIIKSNDRDKQTVLEIKEVMLKKNIDLILNLHDGHGFYRKDYKNTIFNPNAWGQTCVIDQSKLDGECSFSDLGSIAQKVNSHLNANLLEAHHIFNIKNTKTKFEDEAMKLSLTYFAVTHNKPAFAIETSKNLSTLEQKIYYQLRAIEGYMQVMGIEYKRDFELDTLEISRILKKSGELIINSNIAINLYDIKRYINYLPMLPRHNSIELTNILGSFKRVQNHYDIYIGNKKITTIFPQRFKSIKSAKKVTIEIDGVDKEVAIASNVKVNDDFTIKANANLRVNVIGYSNSKIKNENMITISKSDLNKKFSLDKDGLSYRVEFYDGNSFAGMVVVNFNK